MRGLIAVSHAVFAVTLAVLIGCLLARANFVAVAFLVAISIGGVLLRHRLIYWKGALLAFGLMSASQVYAVFGGLEPNSPGALATGDGLKLLIFGLCTLSTILALFVGRQWEARKRAVLH